MNEPNMITENSGEFFFCTPCEAYGLHEVGGTTEKENNYDVIRHK